MIQVKEFLNYQEGQDEKVNEWIKGMGDTIEVINIKYSVSAFQDSRDCNCQEFSGVLIIYKIV